METAIPMKIVSSIKVTAIYVFTFSYLRELFSVPHGYLSTDKTKFRISNSRIPMAIATTVKRIILITVIGF